MSTQITINADETLTVTWTGKKRHGSLMQIGAEGDVGKVNALNAMQLVAIVAAVKSAPFPLGRSEEIYRMCLKHLEEKPDVVKPDINLGLLRKAILERSSQGCNAPYDSYLSVAFDVVTGKTPVHSY